MDMYIYLIERADRWGWDDYTSMVVTSKSPEEAKNFTIRKYYDGPHSSWVKDPSLLKVTEVGKAYSNEEEVILDSFNSG